MDSERPWCAIARPGESAFEFDKDRLALPTGASVLMPKSPEIARFADRNLEARRAFRKRSIASVHTGNADHSYHCRKLRSRLVSVKPMLKRGMSLHHERVCIRAGKAAHRSWPLQRQNAFIGGPAPAAETVSGHGLSILNGRVSLLDEIAAVRSKPERYRDPRTAIAGKYASVHAWQGLDGRYVDGLACAVITTCADQDDQE
jgi:hypothetical protein